MCEHSVTCAEASSRSTHHHAERDGQEIKKTAKRDRHPAWPLVLTLATVPSLLAMLLAAWSTRGTRCGDRYLTRNRFGHHSANLHLNFLFHAVRNGNVVRFRLRFWNDLARGDLIFLDL